MMPKIYFLTFGAGGKDYYDAVERLCNQAKDFGCFFEIIGLTDKDLQQDDEFWLKNKDFIQNNPRGYGYWLWKPYIIYKTLLKMNEFDLLLYLDCGCELYKPKLNVFLSQIELVNKKHILGTFAGSNDLNYTKADLYYKFDLQNNLELLQKNHMQAGALFMKNSKLIQGLFKKYYEYSCEYHLIDDSPSIIPNHPSFREHRHDQSIFNMLVKKLKLHNYDLIATNQGIDYRVPIWYARNKTGKTLIK